MSEIGFVCQQNFIVIDADAVAHLIGKRFGDAFVDGEPRTFRHIIVDHDDRRMLELHEHFRNIDHRAKHLERIAGASGAKAEIGFFGFGDKGQFPFVLRAVIEKKTRPCKLRDRS